MLKLTTKTLHNERKWATASSEKKREKEEGPSKTPPRSWGEQAK